MLSPAAAAATNQIRNLCWTNAPWSDPNFFPLAVWLQAPTNAARYRQAGINTFVGLWQGPTEEQLAALKAAGLYVICAQNDVGRRHLARTNIIAWMHDDEPDNSQTRGARFGFGSPVAPEQIFTDYQRMTNTDPTRPVFLNLGQGVAWDGWYGRGRRNNRPDDYPAYLHGCDIASFDIYPVNHTSAAVAGKLWFVARGVERLVKWTDGQKPVWNCLETTRIDNLNRKPTPHEVRCEAWMSLIHGSRGLIYFAHQFKPKFVEAALLDDAEMLAAVTVLNRQITQLAPVLNRPTLTNVATVASSNPAVPVSCMTKQHAGATYLFAVAMRDGTTTATFTLKNTAGEQKVEVIGEQRMIAVTDGLFQDRFGPWDVHFYRGPAEQR